MLTLLDELALTADPKVAARYNAQAQQGLINPIVLAQLLEVRPQQIYGLIRKGKMATTGDADPFGINSTQKITISLAVANAYAQGYVGRKTSRAEDAEARIKAELAGEVFVRGNK